MKIKYRPSTIMLALVVGILAWLFAPPKPEKVAARAVPNQGAVVTDETSAPASGSAGVISESLSPAPASGPVLSTPAPRSLAALAEPPAGPETTSGLTTLTVMENMRSVFRQYGARFGGNPVGNNREITAALNGGNPRQIVFINPEDGLRINDQAQLVDNWNTPFFFHQLSAAEMEIHSAGPDRKMWTADDLVIK